MTKITTLYNNKKIEKLKTDLHHKHANKPGVILDMLD